MRVCDGCGLKMPRFRPRNNVDGKLMCDGCTEGKPGSPGVPTPGFHGSLHEADMRDLYNDEVKAALIQAHDFGVTIGRDQVADPDPGMGGRPTARINMERETFQANKKRWPQLADELDRVFMEGVKAFQRWNRPTSTMKVAHDSGDGETIYHCPFCGGGQVVAGSDGSVECGFCKTHFTVQVQPEFASMPQTINGVPQHIPGMPGEVGGPAPGAGPVPGQPPGPTAPATDTGTDAFIPDGAFAPPPAVASPVAKLYINANGVAMPEESFIRHLAIAHADDPAPVIEQVREERARV